MWPSVVVHEHWPVSQRMIAAGALRGNFSFGGHISTRTVIRRLHHQGMRARRPIKRPQLTLRHRHARFDWSHSNIPRLTKTLHQSYNDGMVNPEVVCHPSMAKSTVMHANSLPPF
jgi:hypothetical protein